MENVYLATAVLGGTLFLCQFMMTLLGMGGGSDHDLGSDSDAGGDHAGDAGHDSHGAQGHGHEVGHESATQWLVGMLSVRTVTAALAVFGLGGLAATQRPVHQGDAARLPTRPRSDAGGQARRTRRRHRDHGGQPWLIRLDF